MVFVYACGFNAHDQIIPRSSETREAAPPEDVRSLTEITGGGGNGARVLFAGWSSTVCTYFRLRSCRIIIIFYCVV
jgi:hypothetical protein